MSEPESILTIDEIPLHEVSKGLQTSFEAINELAGELSEPRKKQGFARTERLQRARATLDGPLDARRDSVEFEPDA